MLLHRWRTVPKIFSLPHDFLPVLSLFLIARLGLSALAFLATVGGEPVSAWVGHPIFETRALTVPDWGTAGRLLLDGWFRWDTGWYLKIAALGYDAQDGSVAFQPLYPFLIRLIQPAAGGNYLLAALLVSNAACLVALFLFLRAAQLELGDREMARDALLFWIASPAAFFLFAGYTESVFLAFALGAWLCARQKKWGWAALAGALAVLARVQGILLSIPLAWLLIAQCSFTAGQAPIQEIKAVLLSLRERRFWEFLFHPGQAAAWLAVLAPLWAYGAQLLWLQWTGLGSVTAAYQTWLTVVMPWQGLALIFDRLLHTSLVLTDWIDLGLFCAFILLSILGLPKIHPALSLHNWALLVLILMRGAYPYGLISGFMRYTLAAYPLFFVLAQFLRAPWKRNVILGVFLFLQLIFVWAFLNWFWVA